MSWLRTLIHGRSVGTNQTLPLAGEPQVRNSARGYVYAIAPLDRIDRFLILGSEGGTYYGRNARSRSKTSRILPRLCERTARRYSIG
jgi:60 kDa SS-A/Ro ribonucleoprotein